MPLLEGKATTCPQGGSDWGLLAGHWQTTSDSGDRGFRSDGGDDDPIITAGMLVKKTIGKLYKKMANSFVILHFVLIQFFLTKT